jgi:macrolide-specific efflux system membrane fusion protein
MSAHVDQIAYDAKTVNNVTTYEVDVLPEKIPAFMRSGMTASVAFQIAVRQGVVRVPSRAITERDGRAYVQAVDADGRSEERAVKTGLSDGKFTEIVDGLREGEKLLIAQLRAEKRSVGTNPFATTYSRPQQKK